MEMYQVEVFAPDSDKLLMERILCAQDEDDAITRVQTELRENAVAYGICMARALRDGE